MAKEFKVISNKFAERITEDLNLAGLDGWDVTAYVQEYGVTKFILERDIGNSPLDGNSMDSLISLISLVKDEAKTRKLISDLKDAYSSHKDGLDTILAAKDALAAREADVSSKETQAEADKKAIEDAYKALDSSKKDLEAQLAQLDTSKKDLESREVSLKTQATLADNTQKRLKEGHEASVKAASDALSAKSLELKAYEDRLNLRAQELAQQEKEHADILKQTQDLAALLRRN